MVGESRTWELDKLLVELSRHGYCMHSFACEQDGPNVVGAVLHYRHGIADVLILRSETSAVAFRVLTGPGVDEFDPPWVVWHYHPRSPVWTLRAMLALPSPGHPEAPITPMALPAGLGLPADRRGTERVRMRRP